MSDHVGQQIGNYRLVQHLGSGGFADVYLATQIYLDSPAAIKLLRTNLAQDDLESFREEARTLVRLIHPHIVRLLDFGLEGTTPFLVMDYAPNGTLRQRHQRGERLPLATVVDYVQQIASALQYAHDQKVIHRDIKPENMLLGRNQEILLTDFGIAVVAQSTRIQLTQETVGTISYMAPEQIQAHPRPASDQYSLGIVVYEWLCGSRPFSGSFTEVAAKHLMVPPPPLRGQMPYITPEIEEVVFTALAKDPKQRFGSMQAFAIALKQASQARLGAYPTIEQQGNRANQPPLAATIMPPMVQMHPSVPPIVLNTPASPNVFQSLEPAATLYTPARPQENVFTPERETNNPTVGTRPPAPAQLVSSSPIESQPKPRGVSRRALLLTGVAAAGIAVAGGITWYQLPHSSSSGQTAVGTKITPTSKPTQPIVSILAQDTFNRPHQTFWGTASDGFKWSGQANVSPEFTIAGGMGQIHRVAKGGGLYIATLGPAITDAELVVNASLSQLNPSHIGLALRWQDDQNYYKVLLNQSQLSLFKREHNKTSILQMIPFAAQANTLYTIRFRVVGAKLQTKVWQTGSLEPAAWMATATDTAFQSGLGGLRPQLEQNVKLQVSLFTLTTASNS
jgi:serine/threonine protein kinase